jgi:EAL domain-containing protein (putative c-di-GMP-specific phosphodiesterase class I)
LSGINLRVQASAGIALSPLHGSEVDVLLQRADVALYRAKEAGRGSVLVYEQSYDYNSIERLTLMAQLHEGLEKEIVLHYQPKCRLSDGEMVGVEALVRWQHPSLGLLMPDRFVYAAEKVGLSTRLTLEVLRQALAASSEFHSEGLDVSVAVNVSAPQIVNPRLAREVADLYRQKRSPRPKLILEVTESSMITDFQKAAQVVTELRELGIQISIDDFGTGYSSLEYIRDLSPSEVKIDRSFVASSVTSERDMALIRAAAELGRSLGITVVGEGVEDGEQLRAVAEAGCDLVQGFFILPPVPAGDLVSWSRRQKVWSRYLPSQISQGQAAGEP